MELATGGTEGTAETEDTRAWTGPWGAPERSLREEEGGPQGRV